MTDEEAVASVTPDQRLALVSLTADLGEQEADRFWSRYTVMLTLNGGLIAIASFTLSNGLNKFTAGIAALGLALTAVWYRIMSLSQFYEERWRKDLAAIINGDDVLMTLLRTRSRLGPRGPKPARGSSTGHAKFTVLIVGVFWVVLMIYSGLLQPATLTLGGNAVSSSPATTPPAGATQPP